MAKVQIGFPQVGRLFTDHLSLLRVRTDTQPLVDAQYTHAQMGPCRCILQQLLHVRKVHDVQINTVCV